MSSFVKMNEHILTLRKALALHNSMVICGERPSDASEALFREAMDIDPASGAADQGERQQLVEARDLCITMNASSARQWKSSVDPEKMQLQLLMYHTSQVEFALCELLKVLKDEVTT